MAYPSNVHQPAQFGAQAQPSDSRYDTPGSPEPDGGNGAGQRHHRAYQACEACRERKVKCDMGPVDQPHEPPCAKCKREHKQCVFSSSRKKSPSRRNNSVSNVSNGVKRARTGSQADESTPRNRPAPIFQNPNAFQRTSLPPAATGYTSSPINTPARPAEVNGNRSSRSLPQMTPGQQPTTLPPLSRSVQALKTGSGNGGAGGGGDDHFHSKIAATLLSTPIASSQDGMQLLFQAAAETSGQSPSAMQSPNSDSRRSRTFSNVMPGGSNEVTIAIRNPEHEAEIEKALEVWSRFRFVRAGWFTAYEAMNYIEYFYARLAPMTPVVTQDFRSPSRHSVLLTEEPVLALTILAIASRQMQLQGIGAVSRSYSIHDKLWDALRRMVERLLWGQEQFGGGFPGAGSAPLRESTTGQITWKGSLRTLGTIEALLLLTDWQPRALHFPPSSDDENWLVDLNKDHVGSDNVIKEDESLSTGVSLPNSLEPGWRSDRMSWMLLGLAQSLAFELGVFDNNQNLRDVREAQVGDYIRKRRLRRLVLLYVSQTSGRIGIKSMLSPEQDKDEGPFAGYKEDHIDRMQKFWLELGAIMYNVNLYIFPTREHTKVLLESNKYKEEIDKLAPRLNRWKEQFDHASEEFGATMKTVMLMEYEYARLFINSPSFNKVVESWREHGRHVDPQTLASVAEENKKYIAEVKEAATGILSNVLSGFADQQQLRDAPLRTYLRSFAGMVFTLKLFSLGNHEIQVRKYIHLLDHIATAMETQFVDDVHISSQIATLVKALLGNVKNSFIRVQKSGGNSGPPSREQSRQQSPHRASHRNIVRQIGPQDSRFAPVQELSPDPLTEIQARPIADFASSTFIPPPDMNNMDMSNGMNYEANLDASMNDADWFTLPLDNLFTNSHGHQIENLGGIGDTDFLDVITGSNNNPLHHWSNSVYAPGQGMGGMGGF